MKLSELRYHMFQGREFEFTINSHPYFLAPIYNDNHRCSGFFYIYDSVRKENIFEGSYEDIINFQFLPNISFKSAMPEFEFEYIF